MPGEDRDSGELPTAVREPAIRMLQELVREATLAMTKRQWKQAIEKLKLGLDTAAELSARGQPELGATAFTAFGRRMGEALRKDARSAEAIDVLRRALVHAPERELSRALLLEELGLNAALMGRMDDAFGAWLDAAVIAHGCGNAAVERRLMSRIGGDGSR
jgi:tetratricopeptide (TPR) repeat protein